MSIQNSLRRLLITAALLACTTHLPVKAAEKSVRITAIVEHPALDAVRQGILDELRQHGYLPGDNLDWEFQSAQGDTSIAGQIARKFVGDAPDVIVAIATPSAQSVAAAARGAAGDLLGRDRSDRCQAGLQSGSRVATLPASPTCCRWSGTWR